MKTPAKLLSMLAVLVLAACESPTKTNNYLSGTHTVTYTVTCNTATGGLVDVTVSNATAGTNNGFDTFLSVPQPWTRSYSIKFDGKGDYLSVVASARLLLQSLSPDLQLTVAIDGTVKYSFFRYNIAS